VNGLHLERLTQEPVKYMVYYVPAFITQTTTRIVSEKQINLRL